MLVARHNYYWPEEKAGLTGRGVPRHCFKAGAGIRLCPRLLFEPFTAVILLLAMSSPYLYLKFAFALKDENMVFTTPFNECYYNVMRLFFGNRAVNIFSLFHQSGLKAPPETGKVCLQRFQETCTSFVKGAMYGLSPLQVGRLFRWSHFQGEDSSGDVYPFGPSTHCATAAEQRILDGSFY